MHTDAVLRKHQALLNIRNAFEDSELNSAKVLIAKIDIELIKIPTLLLASTERPQIIEAELDVPPEGLSQKAIYYAIIRLPQNQQRKLVLRVMRQWRFLNEDNQ